MRRRGFGIITAIVLLVLIATVGMMIMSIAATSSKKATDDYLRIQAEMLARSATEFALLRVQGFNRADSSNSKCLENVNIDANPFEANATISYFLESGESVKLTECKNQLVKDVSDHDLNGTIMIDVVVTTKDATTSEPIRIHKRTLQKP